MSKLTRDEGLAAEVTEDVSVVRAVYRTLEKGNVRALTSYVRPSTERIRSGRRTCPSTKRGAVRLSFCKVRVGARQVGPRVSAGTSLEHTASLAVQEL